MLLVDLGGTVSPRADVESNEPIGAVEAVRSSPDRRRSNDLACHLDGLSLDARRLVNEERHKPLLASVRARKRIAPGATVLDYLHVVFQLRQRAEKVKHPFPSNRAALFKLTSECLDPVAVRRCDLLRDRALC